MAELSFLIAHALAVAVLFLRSGGMETAELGVGLAVVGPPLLAQAALLLPRLVGAQGFQRVGRRQAVLAWILAVIFVALVALAVDQFARKQLLTAGWQLAAALGILEALYGIYAAWFLQSRLVFNERQAGALREKLAQQDFDVFLCHNSRDKAEVKAVALRLMERRIKPWLDEWELRPGLRWQLALEEQVRQVKSAAVFVGAEGLGPWQSEEIGAFLSACVERGIPVIPVLLPTAPSQPDLPVFLAARMWVDFRKEQPEPLAQLVFGITGQKAGTPPKEPPSTSSKAR
jgi:hypothetical protein